MISMVLDGMYNPNYWMYSLLIRPSLCITQLGNQQILT